MKIPTPIIETENLLIRPYGLRDAGPLFKMMKANRADLIHTFPLSVRGTLSLMKTRKYVLEKQGERRAGTLIVCGIFLQPEEKLVGHVVLTKFDWSVPKCDLGYFIASEYAGKGLATQTARLISQWGFQNLKLEKITMRIWPGNAASIKVAQKLGAREAGLAKRDFRSFDGKLMDCVYYELYR